MIRLILIVIFAIIIFFASLIMLPIFWLIGKFNQDAKDRGSLRFVQGVFKVVLFLSGVTTTVKGLETSLKTEKLYFCRQSPWFLRHNYFLHIHETQNWLCCQERD